MLSTTQSMVHTSAIYVLAIILKMLLQYILTIRKFPHFKYTIQKFLSILESFHPHNEVPHDHL